LTRSSRKLLFSMKIAVTGAFSYTGKYVARRLLEGRQQVITLTGHPGRPDPFGGAIPVSPLDFADESALAKSLTGASVLVNTYWIRFDRGSNTQSRAVENTRKLVEAARAAGVKRLVHVSITKPSLESPLPYFEGKAAIEQIIHESGLSFAILRPTVLFGSEDVLINNIAFLLRRLPVFGVPGDGSYQLQPVHVDDLAALAVDAVSRTDSYTIDAVGPDTFTFKEMVELISARLGLRRPIVHVPPWLALAAAGVLGAGLGDVLLTRDEVAGLMANLLISDEPPRCRTRLSDWLDANRASVGMQYASELGRHYT
jgi:NADH dehydrogenase